MRRVWGTHFDFAQCERNDGSEQVAHPPSASIMKA